MSTPRLTRSTHKPVIGQPFLGDLTLSIARVHEFCGPARRSLALMAARSSQGHIFWIHSHWERNRLHGPSIAQYIDPRRITFVTPKRIEDILWCMEECLRAGTAPFIVAETPIPPPLTPIRRLHLAAEAGAARKKVNPLGVILTQGDGGAQGVESRWHMCAQHKGDQNCWMLQRRRARMLPPAAWQLEWQDGKLNLHSGIN